MSKARELLKRFMHELTKEELCSVPDELQAEIEELLDQPEEGVYQKLLRIEDGVEVEILPSELWQDGYEAGKRSALISKQPEQEPFDWETKKKSYLDEIDRLGVEANKDQEEIDRLTDLLFSKKPATYIGETQWMQVPDPLSDEAICQILLKKEWKGFVDLVRMIEKAHGIGGGE